MHLEEIGWVRNKLPDGAAIGAGFRQRPPPQPWTEPEARVRSWPQFILLGHSRWGQQLPQFAVKKYRASASLSVKSRENFFNVPAHSYTDAYLRLFLHTKVSARASTLGQRAQNDLPVGLWQHLRKAVVHKLAQQFFLQDEQPEDVAT